jgi:hypothetical protein
MAEKEKSVQLMSVEDFDDLDDTQFVEITVPEWKDKAGNARVLRLGSLTADDMLSWVEANDGPAKKTAGLRLIINSLVDASGTRIGSDKMIATLRKRNADVIRRLVEAVLKLNGMTVETEKVKNVSSEAATGASHIASPSSSVM